MLSSANRERDTDTRRPPSHLSESNRIHSFVDPANALLSENLEECLHSSRDFGSCSPKLTPGDLYCFHAGCHPHCEVGLGYAATDAP